MTRVMSDDSAVLGLLTRQLYQKHTHFWSPLLFNIYYHFAVLVTVVVPERTDLGLYITIGAGQA